LPALRNSLSDQCLRCDSGDAVEHSRCCLAALKLLLLLPRLLLLLLSLVLISNTAPWHDPRKS
jgi:hypothetical protein